MFTKSARYYDALYSWKDYEAETARLLEIIRDRVPGADSLLDVACGTGKHLEQLSRHLEAEGIDLDENLLAIARERLPRSQFHHGDMRSFDLGKRFDVVTCLFSSIGYMPTIEDYRSALTAMARHLTPAGILIVEPWFDPREWEPGVPFALFVDEPDLKIARMNVSCPVGPRWSIEFHYTVATAEGVTDFVELHEGGFFTVEEQLDAFRAAGLVVEHDPEGLMGRGLFLAQHPSHP